MEKKWIHILFIHSSSFKTAFNLFNDITNRLGFCYQQIAILRSLFILDKKLNLTISRCKGF